jgi:predicted transcriptional regulator of viral defense system
VKQLSFYANLENRIKDSNGVIFTKDIVAEGIPKIYLSQMVKTGVLVRIDQGVYMSPNSMADKMYYLQHRKPAIVYSHDTALFLHDLSDRDPLTYSVTVPIGYNTKNLKNDGLIVYSINKKYHGIGLFTVVSPFGNNIVTYDMERTICDITRSRNKIDIAVLSDALKRYAKHSDKNISKLMEYAKLFRVTKLIRTYLEVLL